MTEQPVVFVVGPPRAGTTLLQAMLTAGLGAPPLPETHLFTVLAKLAPAFPLSRAAAGELAARIAGRAGFDVPAALFAGAADAGDCFRRLTGHLGAGPGGPVVEKTPRHALCRAAIERALPGVRFAAVVRGPEAVVASNLAAFGAGQSVLRLAVLWNRFADALSDLDARTPGCVVRYEDLAGDPAPVLAGLAGALGLAGFDAARALRFDAVAPGLIADAETWKSGVREGRVDGGRSRAAPGLAGPARALVRRVTAARARRFGYDPGEAPASSAALGLAGDLRVLWHPHQWLRLFDPVDG